MARRNDQVALGPNWDHLTIRPLGQPLAKLVLAAFSRTMDRDRQAMLSGPKPLRNHNVPAITVVDAGDFSARLLRDGLLGFGEAFITGSWRGGAGAGDLRGETDAVVEWLTVYADALTSRETARAMASKVGWRWRMPTTANNSREDARQNIARHYDLPVEFFRLFLDDDLTYSSADYRHAATLEAAQAAKIEGILDLAEISTGGRLLDIGCGWGALLSAATQRGACAVGLTISRKQFDHCSKRLADIGSASVILEDYRDHRDAYDSIVSVEMLEAVGSKSWATYFKQLDQLLKPGGTAVVQTITFPDHRMKRSLGNYSWVDRYIFPGGELISLEEIGRIVSRETSLELTATVRLTASYATTLREWRHRFCDNLDSVRSQGFDAGFTRIWALYLAYFEAAFRARFLDVWQCQLKRR
ncbi:cyclopropane-fatty-acyl-phospholipid synthase family protein [Kribbella sp. NBC_00709]|uniref:cyclopropane-fatty-acyl-phospholipid synthase family protein n=1 Tax=Kribbella sp. NBC_00709 TaxID=2975972 RepID=UPI002E2D210A|nr:cyclopropane-fatty-acyl-phospholipid synthase family protein [Kribbella sp. NBC_00709]